MFSSLRSIAMDDTQFQEILAKLGSLNPEQRRELEQALENSGSPDEVLAIINGRAARCHVYILQFY